MHVRVDGMQSRLTADDTDAGSPAVRMRKYVAGRGA
jgi:hypothetical protein